MPSHFTRTLFVLALCLLPAAARAQAKKEADGAKVFCEPSRALALVGEQLTEAKAFDNPVKRIAVMTRAAGMLWPHEQKQARAVFAEAFELASRHYRERGDEIRQEKGRADSKLPGLTVQLPDQRFVVLRAIARRDAAWARELAARAADETREEAKKDEAAADKERLRPVGEKLLLFAESLLETDTQAALAVARDTFKEPATMWLPHFLYKVAESDHAAADALFKEALAAYADRDLNSLLYLSEYPFALNASIAPVMPYMGVRPPKGFNADPGLQRMFVGAFLGFAERRLAAFGQQPPADEPRSRSEPEVIYTALKVLESLYGASQPAALERINALEGQAITFLSPARQRNAAAYSKRDLDGSDAGPREGAFEATIEQAEKMPADRRDQYIASAVMYSSDSAPLEKVEAAAQKIEEVEARRQVLNWFYFRRGQGAVHKGDFDEARRLAERVESLEGRALLLLTIASEGLRRSDDKQRAEELLSAVTGAARKAPDTVAKARALLGVAHLYARFDYLRGLGALGEAVSVVNKLNDPDLASASLPTTVLGKNFSLFAGWPMPNFTLESSFRELGARDFEATLANANQLGDKYLRATAVLALASKCLEDAEKQEKAKKPAPARGSRRQ